MSRDPIKAQRADGTGPFVEITQVGRWTYDVGGVVDGIGIAPTSDRRGRSGASPLGGAAASR